MDQDVRPTIPAPCFDPRAAYRAARDRNRRARAEARGSDLPGSEDPTQPLEFHVFAPKRVRSRGVR